MAFTKRKIKIVTLYLTGVICLAAYWLLENDMALDSFLQKADNFRKATGFFFFLISGLIKYGLLMVGIGLCVILTVMLIRNKY